MVGWNGEIEQDGKEIICPYCNHKHTDSWECGLNHDGDCHEQECDECGKNFHVNMCVDVTYNTSGLCKENNTKHKWNYFDHTTNDKRCFGRKCLVCGEYEFNIDEDKDGK